MRINGSIQELTYSNKYQALSRVELSPIADYDWVFDHWSGDLSGDETVSLVNMDGKKHVYAHFIRFRHHPESLTVGLGEDATFITGLNDNNLKYQWQKNSINIEGADFPYLTIRNVNSSSTDSEYRCIITYPDGRNIITNSAIISIKQKGNGGIKK